MNERWFWCDIKYATFGFSSVDNVIRTTAPIFSWAQGKTLAEVKPWLLKRNARVIELPSGQDVSGSQS